MKDYIGTDDASTRNPAERFRHRFRIPQTLYKRLKEDVLNQRPEYWETRMIDRRSTGKRTVVKILNCWNMLSSGNRKDRNDDVTYIAEETKQEYVL